MFQKETAYDVKMASGMTYHNITYKENRAGEYIFEACDKSRIFIIPRFIESYFEHHNEKWQIVK